ncbi:MAG TPA: hypothetical protein VGL51_02735 [Solirubrobacteraceae bacterium]|jgi:hypothetical protein
MMRRWVALTALAAVWTAVPSAMAAPVPPLIAAARLSGSFVMSGTVTRAVGVPGERAGQTVLRTWSFVPLCEAGGCAAVQLARARPGGTDQVLLQRQGPGFYTGVGSFLAPSRCHGIVYRRGALVPFTISVRVTAAAPVGALVQATQVRATYRNRKRINLTKCFAAPSYDSASYLGAPLAAGAIRTVARTRSSTASRRRRSGPLPAITT